MERLDGSVRGALRHVGVPDSGLLAEVVRVWPETVGPAIARAAWPLRIGRDGTLHVAVESAAWAHELALLEPELRTRLDARLGHSAPGVTGLRFAVGPVPSPGADPTAAPSPAPSPGVEEQAVASAVASAIEDPELRELVRRAAAASLASRRSDRDV